MWALQIGHLASISQFEVGARLEGNLECLALALGKVECVWYQHWELVSSKFRSGDQILTTLLNIWEGY